MQIEQFLNRVTEIAKKYPGSTVHMDWEGDFFPVKQVSPFLTVDPKGHIKTDVLINT